MYADTDDRRECLRIDHEAALNYKEVKETKLSTKTEMLTMNVSATGLLIRTSSVPPALSSTIWIELDPKMINICSEIESDLIIKDGGVFGRVVRISEGEPGVSYDVGICFLRKKSIPEQDLDNLLDKS